VKKMLKPIILANAVAIVMVVWVTACALLSFIAPDLLFLIAQSWTHTINLELAKTTSSPNLENIVLGLVSASGLTWVTVYGIVSLYNRWSK